MAAAIDNFVSVFAPGITGPLQHLVNVSPDDANDLVNVSRAIYIGGAGAVKVTTVGGETIVIPSGALAVGVPHPIRVTRIWSASTTATSIMYGW